MSEVWEGAQNLYFCKFPGNTDAEADYAPLFWVARLADVVSLISKHYPTYCQNLSLPLGAVCYIRNRIAPVASSAGFLINP